MPRIISKSNSSENGPATMDLTLHVTDPMVLGYLQRFEGDNRIEKAQEALKVGVIALQQASPTLDTQVVQEKFSAFEKELGEQFSAFLGERDGVLPRSLERFFGEHGLIAGLFNKHFDPTDGRLAKLIENQIGPASKFAKALDPKNKEGVIALIENKVRELIESKVDELLGEFSLDDEKSALSRLKELLAGGLGDIKKALGVEQGRQEEAKRGHVKGFSFQEDVYQPVAELGRQLGDETEFVANTAVRNGKTGDHLITLGKCSGAPGLKMVVEAKERELSMKKAVEELAEAKDNRGAAIGIFVWAKGCEPAEVGDFRMIDDDFYCTADKEDLQSGHSLLFLEAAYKIARMMAVLKTRKEAAGNFDAAQVTAHVSAIIKEIEGLSKLAKKAGSMKKNSEEIEEALQEMNDSLGTRLNQILELLSLDEAA
jgi:hypothetical protein